MHFLNLVLALLIIFYPVEIKIMLCYIILPYTKRRLGLFGNTIVSQLHKIVAVGREFAFVLQQVSFDPGQKDSQVDTS